MICGSLLVFFLSLLTLVELTGANTRKVMCGEDVEIPSDCNEADLCNSTLKIVNMTLKVNNKIFLEMEDLTNVDENCSEDGRICLKVVKDRKRATLTIHDVTFADEGKYYLYINRSDGNIQPIYKNVLVYGVCEPKVSRSEDELTCKGTMKNISIPTIDWMSKERKRYPGKLVENVTGDSMTWRITLKLTDETRQMTMCCTASYTQNMSEEKQNCLPVPAGSYNLNEDMNRSKIMIPILVVLVMAIAVALYVYHRHRPCFARPRRENPEEEITKEKQSDPLQSPEGKV